MFVDNCGPVVFVNFILTEYLEVPVVLVTGLQATVTVLTRLLADHLQGILILLRDDRVQAVHDKERLVKVTVHLLCPTHYVDPSTFGAQFTGDTIVLQAKIFLGR